MGLLIFQQTNSGRPPLQITAVHPNPVIYDLHFSVLTSTGGNVEIEVFNALGLNVYKDRRTLLKGDTELIIAAKALPTGSYFLRIHSKEGKASSHFIKQR